MRRYPYVAMSLVAAIGAAGWTVAVVQARQGKPAAPPPPAERAAQPADGDHANPLETLDWLVGDWVATGEETTVEFSCKFTKNRAFLIRSFRTLKKDGAGPSGMQVIAWDPARETIRSWTYDSAGGFGEETWTQSGDRYTIRSKYTLPDGGLGSAVNVLTYVNDDACTWKSVNREIDGEFHPDSPMVVIVRAADEADGLDADKKEGK